MSRLSQHRHITESIAFNGGKQSRGYLPGEQEAIAAYIATHKPPKIPMGTSCESALWAPKASTKAAAAKASILRTSSTTEANFRAGQAYWDRLCELVGPSPRPAHRAMAVKQIAEEFGTTGEKVTRRIYELRKAGRIKTFSNGDVDGHK